MKEKRIVIKTVKMKVAEFVEKHNKENAGKQITRHDVYAMIKSGDLKAHKGFRNAWIIEFDVEEEIEVEVPDPVKPKSPSSKKSSKKDKIYTVKEFVKAYNEKHVKNPTTVEEVRKLLKQEKLKGEKVYGKWMVTASPSKRIK